MGVPSSSSGAFRITTGLPSRSRTTTSNSHSGVRPSSSVTTSTSLGDAATTRPTTIGGDAAHGRRAATRARRSRGAPRFATDAPAASIRSTGSASGMSRRRIVGPSAASAPFGDDLGSARGAAAREAPSTGWASPARIVVSSCSTNWFSSFVLTSAMMPRPNCATLPVTVRSVCTVTFVPDASGTSDAVISAEALPCPFVSRPSAFSTALWLVSSFSTNVALPLYCAVIGPTFTLTMPRYSSPSISCSWAPGSAGAMRSTSVRTAHVSSTGRSTRNSFVSSIASDPPRCRCRRDRRSTLLRLRDRAGCA